MDLRFQAARVSLIRSLDPVSTQALHPAAPRPFLYRLRSFYALTKPRVVSLIVFTAVIGMFLSTPGMVPLQILLAGTVGIALVAGAAAAINCLVEQKIDALMRRTSWRPLPRGDLTAVQTLVFAGTVGGLGLWLLSEFVNPLTMWLTLGTFVGYAIVYTVILKPATPQNIVIGGASGAMPPVLGWAAVTGEVTTEAMMLFLIIYTWTPPHFWALALYRTEEYAKAGLPMLPVTHGQKFTRLHVLLYTLIMFAASLLPFVVRMNGWLYLTAALVLGGIFIAYAVRIYRDYSDDLARRTFRYSIVYLSLLFAALLADHYLVA
jgi:protoheme IX farnesyltransferase